MALVDHIVFAWGWNATGGLGQGSTSGPQTCASEPAYGCSSKPVPVPGLDAPTAVASGSDYNMALLRNGTVMAWGTNQDGQLGDGTTTGPDVCPIDSTPCSTSPVPVSGLSGVKQIAAGNLESIALLTNGKVKAWGYNASGLGNGSTENDVPVTVTGLKNVTQVACGDDSSGESSGEGDATCLALIKGGTVMAWGDDTGNVVTPTSPTPIAVPGLSRVTDIAPGADFNMVLKSTGRVEVWGSDTYGDLGNGTSGAGVSSATPFVVPGLAHVTAIAAGSDNGEAVLSNGKVKTWGQNFAGELGNGTTTDTDVPATVPGLSGVIAISTSADHTIALG